MLLPAWIIFALFPVFLGQNYDSEGMPNTKHTGNEKAERIVTNVNFKIADD